MAIPVKLAFAFSIYHFALLDSYVDGAEDIEKHTKCNDSILIGIFIGIWICISCYVITGWIVDIALKRRVFCKSTSSREGNDLHSYASTTSTNQNTSIYTQSTELNDLHRMEKCDEDNPRYTDLKRKDNIGMNGYTESLYVDMKSKQIDSEYIDMTGINNTDSNTISSPMYCEATRL